MPDAVTRAPLFDAGEVGMLRTALNGRVRMQSVVAAWAWPPIAVCRYVPAPGTGYTTLGGNCEKNRTLPGLAFGFKSCSMVSVYLLPRDEALGAVRPGGERAGTIRAGARDRMEGDDRPAQPIRRRRP